MFNNPVAEYIFNFKHTHGENWIEELWNDALMQPLLLNVYNNYMIIKYRSLIPSFIDEAFWDKNNEFYQYCRSLVIDYDKEQIVLYPYKKFFNINERQETSKEKVIEKLRQSKIVYFTNKLDGAYIAIRYYNNEFVVSSSAGLDPATNWHVKKGYEYLAGNKNLQTAIKDNANNTFIFELIDKDDPHAINYSQWPQGLYLTGIIDNNGNDLSPHYVVNLAEQYGILHTTIIRRSFNDIYNSLNDNSISNQEGYVLYLDGYRVKMKYNTYVLMHKELSKLVTPKSTIAAIRNNTFDDFIAKIPAAFQDLVLSYAQDAWEYAEMQSNITQDYLTQVYKYFNTEDIDRKDAMLYITNNISKEYQAWVRNSFLNKTNDYLKYYN
jgi:hypothetical protein